MTATAQPSERDQFPATGDRSTQKRPIVAEGNLLVATFREFLQDGCLQLGAGIAYYTIFSLPPLLVMLLLLGSWLIRGFGAGEVGIRQEQIVDQVAAEIDVLSKDQLRSVIRRAGQLEGATWKTLFGLAVLAFGATGVLGQLQAALNRVWSVEPDPERSGALHYVQNFLVKRALSFLMILAMVIVLLLSLVLSVVLGQFGTIIEGLISGGLSKFALMGINFVVSLAAATLLFAAVFRILPDARISWKDAWIGAAVTGLLFVIGKFAVDYYLGMASIGSAYGAAGSLALLLVWVYYNSLTLLLGAEFTQVYAARYGDGIRPADGAVRVVWEKQIIR